MPFYDSNDVQQRLERESQPLQGSRSTRWQRVLVWDPAGSNAQGTCGAL